MSDRQQMRIFVSGDAKVVVEKFATEFDMTEMGVASRLYMWFANLPKPVQKYVVGLTDASEGAGMELFAGMLARQVAEAKGEDLDLTSFVNRLQQSEKRKSKDSKAAPSK